VPVPAPEPRNFLPHPLVVALGEGLGGPSNRLGNRALELEVSRQPAPGPGAGGAAAAEPTAPDGAVQRVADALAQDLHVDQLVMFVGYLGGATGDGGAAADAEEKLQAPDAILAAAATVSDDDEAKVAAREAGEQAKAAEERLNAAAEAEPAPISQTDWLVFYLDARLQTWLLVQREAIVLRRTVHDELSLFGSHDVIWVRGQAPIRHGTGPQSIQQRFLTGDFTRAGDFDAPPTGGTFSSPSGLLCAAGSPGCCPRHTIR
jgi:hypothetical protein